MGFQFVFSVFHENKRYLKACRVWLERLYPKTWTLAWLHFQLAAKAWLPSLVLLGLRSRFCETGISNACHCHVVGESKICSFSAPNDPHNSPLELKGHEWPLLISQMGKVWAGEVTWLAQENPNSQSLDKRWWLVICFPWCLVISSKRGDYREVEGELRASGIPRSLQVGGWPKLVLIPWPIAACLRRGSSRRNLEGKRPSFCILLFWVAGSYCPGYAVFTAWVCTPYLERENDLKK